MQRTRSANVPKVSEHLNFLKKLVVGIGEVSLMTGIPYRKIRYWLEKGLINCIAEGSSTTRRFDYTNIRKIILIDEFLKQGYALEAAAARAAERVRIEMEPIQFRSQKQNTNNP